jgi:NADP-dependent 3-hydroxy acid dehydrogenase YdfG
MLLGPALDVQVTDWDQMVAVNVRGLPYVTHPTLPHLVRAAADAPRRVADLIGISSTARRRAQ